MDINQLRRDMITRINPTEKSPRRVRVVKVKTIPIPFLQNLSEVVDGYYAYMEESKMAARKKSVAGEEASRTDETDGRIKVRVILKCCLGRARKSLPRFRFPMTSLLARTASFSATSGPSTTCTRSELQCEAQMKATVAGGNGENDRFEFSRTILPELEKCQEDPKRLRNLFQTRRDRFKTIYGKFCLNNPKSEYIINNHEKYFTVSACELRIRGVNKGQYTG